VGHITVRDDDTERLRDTVAALLELEGMA
jgi:hypothetical protein